MHHFKWKFPEIFWGRGCPQTPPPTARGTPPPQTTPPSALSAPRFSYLGHESPPVAEPSGSAPVLVTDSTPSMGETTWTTTTWNGCLGGESVGLSINKRSWVRFSAETPRMAARSTQPSISPGSVNRVPALLAGVKVECTRLCRAASKIVWHLNWWHPVVLKSFIDEELIWL